MSQYLSHPPNELPDPSSWDLSEALQYSGGGFSDLPNGESNISWPDGRTYSGSIVNGTFQGVGLLAIPPRDVYRWAICTCNVWRALIRRDFFRGDFRNGTFNGNGSFTWTDGRTYKGLWKDGKPNGKVYILQEMYTSVCTYLVKMNFYRVLRPG